MLFALFIPFLKSVNTAILLTCEEEVPYGVIQAVLSLFQYGFRAILI